MFLPFIIPDRKYCDAVNVRTAILDGRRIQVLAQL